MTPLDWILVAAGLACGTYALWPERRTSTALLSPNPKGGRVLITVKAGETDDFKLSLAEPPHPKDLRWTEGGKDFRTIVRGMEGVAELCDVRFSPGKHPTFDVRYRVPDAEWLDCYLYRDESGHEYRVTVPVRVVVQSREGGADIHNLSFEATWIETPDSPCEAQLMLYEGSRDKPLWSSSYPHGSWTKEATIGATDVGGPAGGKRAWEIAGARKKHFTLKEAAALIAGADPIFPLTGLARDEYDTLCQDVESGTLPVLVPRGKEFAPIYGGKPVVQELALKAQKQFHEDILQKVRVEREPLRDYIRSQGRPVPEFLIERFDSTATLKPRVPDR